MSDQSVSEHSAAEPGISEQTKPGTGTDESGSGRTTPPRGDEMWPTRRYQPGRLHHVENALTSILARTGLIPHTYLLTTQGRKTGRSRSNPVTVVVLDGQRWLVAPYGPVSWVHNARAAGKVELTRGRTTRVYEVHELTAQQAGRVLKHYVHLARVTQPYFRARPDSPVEDFSAEAALHPVFELVTSDQA
jgi:deazaflavin-dependent oxidoreductase (nitroreductase family)